MKFALLQFAIVFYHNKNEQIIIVNVFFELKLAKKNEIIYNYCEFIFSV